VGGEDGWDGLAGALFQDGVHVEKWAAQTLGHQTPDRALAGAHEAGQDQLARSGAGSIIRPASRNQSARVRFA
jgi:hypothetical protein